MISYVDTVINNAALILTQARWSDSTLTFFRISATI